MRILFHAFVILVSTSFVFAYDQDECLSQLADYWHSYSRENDSSILGSGLFPEIWLPQTPKHTDAYKWVRENKATPDECFYGVDAASTAGPCPAGSSGTNKTNQGYAWSAVKNGQSVFWGTVANYLCLASLPVLQQLNSTGPTVTPDVVCLNSYNARGIPNDYHPPQIFVRNENAPVGTQTRLSDQILATPAAALLNITLGIRAAGVANGVALFSGANLPGTAINLFAFNAATGAFIGATNFTSFSDVRKFATIGGQTYLAVFATNGYGFLLRYLGSPTSPLAFGVVAKLHGNPADITVFDTATQRLLISTWATPSAAGFESGRLILSPANINSLPVLAAANNAAAIAALPFTAGFTVVWDVLSYDPDPVTAYTLGASVVGEAADGWFYWGTFQFPPEPLGYFQQVYHPEVTTENVLKIFLGTHRPTSIFRGRHFDTTPEVELLYGERYFPVYNGTTGKWTAKPNKLGATPKYGRAGFGNVANVYTWSANSYKGNVLLGTFDESFIFASFLKSLIPTVKDDTYNLQGIFGFQPFLFGGDLYVFNSQKNEHAKNPNPAQWASLTGLDNYVNYGIRNIVNDPASPDEDRWATTANPFNVNPQGGWELYRLTTTQ